MITVYDKFVFIVKKCLIIFIIMSNITFNFTFYISEGTTHVECDIYISSFDSISETAMVSVY